MRTKNSGGILITLVFLSIYIIWYLCLTEMLFYDLKKSLCKKKKKKLFDSYANEWALKYIEFKDHLSTEWRYVKDFITVIKNSSVTPTKITADWNYQ